MRLITCHGGRLQSLFSEGLGEGRGEIFSTGLPEIDALLPGGGLGRGAVHEILGEPGGAAPLFFAMLLARAVAGFRPPLGTTTFSIFRASSLIARSNLTAENAETAERNAKNNAPGQFLRVPPRSLRAPRLNIHAQKFEQHRLTTKIKNVVSTRGEENFHHASSHRAIVWCDPGRSIYAPALAAAGMDLDRVYLLRPRSPRDLLWGMAESLRCPGVAAVIGMPAGLSRIEARRLQLAAETGGGTGLLLRMPLRGRQLSSHYAAATRWVVSPASGDPMVQRWKIRLVHCHGGDIEKTILLEHCRETNSVRAVSELADGLGRPGTAGA
jgi:hypothetical protein